MAKQTKTYGRKLVRIPMVNTRAVTVTDITGSLAGITEPSRSILVMERQRTPNSSFYHHTTSSIDTGSLQDIKIPTSQSQTLSRPLPEFPMVVSVNLSREFNDDVLLYSARAIEKSITSFNSGSNSLIIGNTTLDSAIGTPKKEEFEVYYNGLRIMPIFIQSITQEGSDVVIVLNQDIINYTSLQLHEVFVIGKFK